VGEVNDWPPCFAEGISEALHLGDRAHKKWHVDCRLWHVSGNAAKATVAVNEVVLHIHDNERGLRYFRQADHGGHCAVPWVVGGCLVLAL
jgi:hypothetical protein